MKDVLKAIALAAARAREGNLPFWRQLVEMTVLWGWRRHGPTYYQLARFWRKEMSWRDKLRHLTEAEYQREVGRLNPQDYRKISQHKVVEKAVLTLLGFNTPTFLGYFHRSTGRAPTGQPLRNASELAAVLSSSSHKKLCFKLVEGWGGNQFRAIEVLGAGDALRLRDLANRDVMNVVEFTRRLDSADGYLIEAFIEQHPTLAELNPSSLNTVRIWIVLTENGSVISGSFLRVGRAGSVVDNTSSGGLVCPIDVGTGIMSYADEAGPDRVIHENHPDTGARISGVLIPHWEKCKLLAREALLAFPRMGFAGLDIAVGVDFPQIIELNVQPDRRGAADFDVPTAIALNMKE